MFRALCPVLFALAAALGAADSEVLVNDVRLGLGMGPMPDEQDGTFTAPPASAGGSTMSTYDDTPGLSVSLGGMYGRLAPVGLLVGFEVRSITGEMAFSSLTVNGTTSTADQLAASEGDRVPGMSFSQTGLAANLGVGWAITSSVHLELVGIAGIDWTTWDNIANLGVGNMSVQEGQGFGHTLGGRLGVYWTDPETSWQFGLEGEYVRTASEIETSYIDVTIESEPVNAGLALRAVFGHRF